MFFPFKYLLGTALAFAMQASLVWGQSSPYRRILVDSGQETMGQLAQLGILPDHSHAEEKGLVVEWSSEEYQLALDAHVQMQVLVEDLESWYAQRASEDGHLLARTQSGFPPNFHLGSMGGYLTYDEIESELAWMSANYPSIVARPDSIGVTAQGRTIWMLKISDHPDLDESEPEVLYNALHHAREPISMMQLVYFMHHLLAGYGQDSLATYLINERELYFIPVVNPDGYYHNQMTNPSGGGMWRKNRVNSPTGAIGVDLNRNYGYRWGFDNIGSSPSPSSNTYRGDAAFSELETQAIRNLCMDREFRTALSHHGYGEYMIYPWGYSESDTVPELGRFMDFSTSLVADNHFYPGNNFETVGYLANGVMDDWMFAERGIKPKAYSLSPESGNAVDGFWPSPSRIYEISEAQLSPNLRIACLAGACVDLHDIAPIWLAGSTIQVPVKIRNHGLDAAGPFLVQFSLANPSQGTVQNPVYPAVGLASDSEFILNFGVAVSPSVAAGTWIQAEIRLLLPGGVEKSMTIKFQFGAPDVIAMEDGENGNGNWIGTWATTTEQVYSGSYSFTDSPYQDYGDNVDLTTTRIIDLSNYQYAALSFKGIWEVDHASDFVQVLGSPDGTNFVPLPGNLSWLGVAPGQPANSPLYEGRRYEWAEEHIDLHAFAGGLLYLRFALHSDGWRGRKGFFFDDLVVTGYKNATATTPGTPGFNAFLTPNPSHGSVKVWSQQPLPDDSRIAILDLQGREVYSAVVSNGQELSLKELPAGVYLYRISGTELIGHWCKWVKE